MRNVNLPLTDPADGAEFWKMVRDGDLDQLRSILADGKAAGRMIASYRTIIKERTAEHSRVLHALAEDSVPALMHCAAGKDRAGLSIAVSLLAVGVEREAIEADYLKSNDPHRRYKVRRSDNSAGRPMSPEVMELLSPLFDARAEYLAAAFETIEETWGGVEPTSPRDWSSPPRRGSGCASGCSTRLGLRPARCRATGPLAAQREEQIEEGGEEMARHQVDEEPDSPALGETSLLLR